jgi:hypothetical protein
MKNGKIFSFILTALFFVSGSAFAQKGKKDKPLDGFNYDVKITIEAQTKPTKPLEDDLSFKSDKLKSKVLAEKYKFKPGAFTATVDSSNIEEVVITFDAVMKGETDDDLLTWHGTVTGEDIEGTAIWTKKGKTKKSFAIVGIQKKKK